MSSVPSIPPWAPACVTHHVMYGELLAELIQETSFRAGENTPWLLLFRFCVGEIISNGKNEHWISVFIGYASDVAFLKGYRFAFYAAAKWFHLGWSHSCHNLTMPFFSVAKGLLSYICKSIICGRNQVHIPYSKRYFFHLTNLVQLCNALKTIHLFMIICRSDEWWKFKDLATVMNCLWKLTFHFLIYWAWK